MKINLSIFLEVSMVAILDLKNGECSKHFSSSKCQGPNYEVA